MWLPEDRAKLHALWDWRSEHCGSCNQRRADWFDGEGKPLRDPPFEIAEAFCPACAEMAEYHDEVKDDPRPPGTIPYYRPVDDETESSDDDA